MINTTTARGGCKPNTAASGAEIKRDSLARPHLNGLTGEWRQRGRIGGLDPGSPVAGMFSLRAAPPINRNAKPDPKTRWLEAAE